MEGELMERVRALESVVQMMQVEQKARNEWSSQQLHSLEKQLSSASSSPSSSLSSSLPSLSSSSSMPSSPLQRSPRLAYSSSFEKPEVPCVFQMPLHYPKYSKADYDAMPEWKLDGLLEEYGLPVMGSVREKRQYAMGVFLWN